MIRRIAGLAVAAVAVALVAFGGTADAGSEQGDKKKVQKQKRAEYVHTVFFYLKKDAPAGEVEALIKDTHKLLGKIPSVRGLWVGRPAAKSTPKFALTDYQVGLLVFFDDYSGLQTYLDHPLHTEYLEKHGKYWDKVPVYDFANQKK
ncbi:MAG: Dabb family protein [Gemmataceae bacterium]|nr:Dabb family protein [Gemmataceae bacterium]